MTERATLEINGERFAVQTLRVDPQDIIVLRVEDQLSEESRLKTFENARAIFPNNQVVILDSGAELSVVKP